MRVIAGTLRGRTIKAPKGLETRPTLDRVREAIFSSIGSKITDAFVLDLFAGSGALGIESISRGAREAHFVDSSRVAIKIIEDNLQNLNIESLTKVRQIEAKPFIENSEAYYDLIFVDAPYSMNKKDFIELIEGIIIRMNKEAIIIVEHSKSLDLSLHFIVSKVKHYGQTAVSYIREEDL